MTNVPKQSRIFGMIDFYNERQKIAFCREEMRTLSDALKIPALIKDVEGLEKERAKDDFWLNVENAQSVGRRITAATKKIDRVNVLNGKIEEIDALLDLIIEMEEENEVINAVSEVEKLVSDIAALSVEALLNGKYDNANAILSLHAGAGGTEAQDWVEMLYRMYSRFAENENYAVRELDKLDGDDAGIKSVTFSVSGENAYGYLKAEMGVHRLVRISPFDANKRRHTSFASLEVMPEIGESEDVIINAEDLRIDTYRSGGAGGQHVNKTDSAVRITHIPTGIVVQCQNERSQIQNRETAMKMLVGKLAEIRERQRLEEAQNIKGDLKKIEWGSQIRSYVFCPYTMVKDHRTNFEITDVQKVMDGEVKPFILEYLKKL